MGHLMDDPLPEGMFGPDEEAIIIYARASAVMQPITDDIWSALRQHFDTQDIIEIAFIVGLNQLVSRFHALAHTDLDEATTEQVRSGSCRVRLPPPPPNTTN